MSRVILFFRQGEKSSRWREFNQLSLDEQMMTICITHTFVFYLCGALYLLAPILAWTLLARMLVQWVSAKSILKQNAHWLIILWILSAILLQISLVIGHVNFDLGLAKTIKSTVGWAKGWALLPIFMLLGYYGQIRYQVLCRAACIIGLLSLIVTPLLVLAYILGLPGHLYVSPLKVLGGAGSEFFTVILYEVDPFNGAPRWRFFAPWAPAVGLVANIYFIASWFEKNLRWRLLGLAGNAAMIALAVSRMGMIVMLVVPIAVWGLSRLSRPWLLTVLAIGVIILALLIEPISNATVSMLTELKEARADSTRVRAALANIALYQWQTEAFWFGHGVVTKGTHLVEFMPIGSHHHWYGLLFVKGLVGFVSFLVPSVLTLCVLIVKAQYQLSSRLALGILLILACFSITENLEALAYLSWPAWVFVGIGLKSVSKESKALDGNIFNQVSLAFRDVDYTTRFDNVGERA